MQSRPLMRAVDHTIGNLGLPLIGIVVFLSVWQFASGRIDTSLGKFPGPAMVWEQAGGLLQEFRDERQRKAEFYVRQEQRSARMKIERPEAVIERRSYSGAPTFPEQIATSLKTVFTGFLFAAVLAIPLGIVIGLSSAVYKAINPIIQLFKPVSPLAWLPLVTIVVSSVYINVADGIPKSYVTSAFTVMLCCLWPTVINTAVGVTSVSSDWVNVSKVLRLNFFRHIRYIVFPAAVPMIFTGLRLSLSTAWMVLIAAEMLSQNPGLGKFVWDEFQNGNSNSLGRIMVAVLTIGLIGYALDRGMLFLQQQFSWDKQAVLR
jgi:nitrate/nitrite transport system permease protein